MSEPAGEGRPPDLASSLVREVEGLDRELTEIEMLAGQARSEAERHETKRAQTAERLTMVAGSTRPDVKEIVELNGQLSGLTKRAALMEAQNEVLEGKRKILARYREGLVRVIESLGAMPSVAVRDGSAGQPADIHTSASVNRLLQSAQEDLRRDIARSMHDGPAQSLTNIVLQAQIVDRLLERDPAAARAEVRELVAMVQRTLEATKTFIFDVRPMVLDDLGLVPTLRRVARDRSRQAQVPVDFESLGTDRRVSMEIESGVFRVADEALTGLAALRPDRLTVRLDWAESDLDARITAVSAAAAEAPAAPPASPPTELPPALAAIAEQRRAPRAATIPGLPDAVRRGLTDRAASFGATLEIADDGRSVHLSVALPPAEQEPTPA